VRRPTEYPAFSLRTSVEVAFNANDLPGSAVGLYDESLRRPERPDPIMNEEALSCTTVSGARWRPDPVQRSGRGRHSDRDDELPADVTLLADPVRLRNIGEGKGLRDREGEAPGLDQRADLGE